MDLIFNPTQKPDTSKDKKGTSESKEVSSRESIKGKTTAYIQILDSWKPDVEECRAIKEAYGILREEKNNLLTDLVGVASFAFAVLALACTFIPDAGCWKKVLVGVIFGVLIISLVVVWQAAKKKELERDTLAAYEIAAGILEAERETNQSQEEKGNEVT